MFVRDRHCKKTSRRGRNGLAAAELAVLLPLLTFINLAVIDYSRLVFSLVTIADCARTGANYWAGTGSVNGATSAQVQAVTLQDAVSLSTTPTVTPSNGTDSAGNTYVKVTVSYTFKTIVNYPGIPSSTTFSRSVTMVPYP